MNRLLVFVKYPEAGRVKTRLCPPLKPEEAARLYEAMMLDSIEQYSALEGIEVRPQIDPPERRSDFKALLPGLELDDQRGADLGVRLAAAFEAAFNDGCEKVVAIGTDHPSLDPVRISQAFEALKNENDLVIGPADDGGYYLLGLRARRPGIFKDIQWSGPRVLEQTTEKVAEIGLNLCLLEAWYDVDTVEGLKRLESDLSCGKSRAPRVRKALGL